MILLRLAEFNLQMNVCALGSGKSISQDRKLRATFSFALEASQRPLEAPFLVLSSLSVFAIVHDLVTFKVEKLMFS